MKEERNVSQTASRGDIRMLNGKRDYIQRQATRLYVPTYVRTCIPCSDIQCISVAAATCSTECLNLKAVSTSRQQVKYDGSLVGWKLGCVH